MWSGNIAVNQFSNAVEYFDGMVRNIPLRTYGQLVVEGVGEDGGSGKGETVNASCVDRRVFRIIRIVGDDGGGVIHIQQQLVQRVAAVNKAHAPLVQVLAVAIQPLQEKSVLVVVLPADDGVVQHQRVHALAPHEGEVVEFDVALICRREDAVHGDAKVNHRLVLQYGEVFQVQKLNLKIKGFARFLLDEMVGAAIGTPFEDHLLETGVGTGDSVAQRDLGVEGGGGGEHDAPPC